MRFSVAEHHRLALLLILALLCPGCVKLPRHTSAAAAQTAQAVVQSGASANAPPININTASPAELESLPGIGKALAARIVAHRKLYGRFRRAEHLLMVRGISDKRWRTMRALIAVE